MFKPKLVKSKDNLRIEIKKTIVKCSHVQATKPNVPLDVIQRKGKINERDKKTYKESNWEKVLTQSFLPSFLEYVKWHFGLCRTSLLFWRGKTAFVN